MYPDRMDDLFAEVGVNPQISTVPFDRVNQLPRTEGVYIIHDAHRVIYVGQASGRGGIRARFQPHHVNKARGTCVTQEGRRISGDGQGWQEGRSESWWLPDTWRVEYVKVESAVARTYLEGAIMWRLKPYANDECYRDRHLTE